MALTRTFMQLRPIVAALRRHKVATVLIVLQVALTLAVASNALFIVATRIVHLSRPTGTDEAHLFVIRNGWTLGQNATQIDANIRADLFALRHVAGVRDAFSSQSFPMAGYDAKRMINLKVEPDQKTSAQLATFYAADQHAIDTLGVSLVAGRNFRPDEVTVMGPDDKIAPSVIIVTRSLADKLFPGGPALGKTVYLPGGPAAIIGVLGNLQGPLKNSGHMDGYTALVPARYIDPEGVVYLVRTYSTNMKPVMAAALKALQKRGGVRIIDPKDGVVTMPQIRERAYAEDRSVALLMSILSGLLVLATAGGIVGLSSFWVSQRRRQIGVRRALGATRSDILRYFQTENFLIVSSGIVLGMLLGYAANLLLMTQYELPHMPLYMLAIGATLLWLLGQLAVLGPALRAAAVPPIVATRSV